MNSSIASAIIGSIGLIITAFIAKLHINKIDSIVMASIILSIALIVVVIIVKFF